MTKSRVCESMCDHLEKNAAIIVAKLGGQKSIREECSAPSPWRHRLFLRLPATLYWRSRSSDWSEPENSPAQELLVDPIALPEKWGRCSLSAFFAPSLPLSPVQRAHLVFSIFYDPWVTHLIQEYQLVEIQIRRGSVFPVTVPTVFCRLQFPPGRRLWWQKWCRIEFHEGGPSFISCSTFSWHLI